MDGGFNKEVKMAKGDNKPAENPVDFDALESQLEPDLRTSDDNKPTKDDNKSKPAKKENIEGKNWEEKYNLLVKEKENSDLRYETSSKEGKRLSDELKDLTPFKELMNRIGTDEKLQQKIKDHIGGKKESEVKEEINADELLASPPEYAKYMTEKVTESVLSAMDKRLSAHDEKNKEADIAEKRQTNEIEFMKKRGWDETKMEDFKEKMKKKQLTLDDMDLILNRDEIFKNIAEGKSNETLEHLKSISDKNPSLAHIQSAEEEKSDDAAVFDVLKKQDATIEDMLDGK